MIAEVNVFGVYVPTLLLWSVVAFLLGIPVKALLGRIGFYRYVWHRNLFNFALFIVLLGVVVGCVDLHPGLVR